MREMIRRLGYLLLFVCMIAAMGAFSGACVDIQNAGRDARQDQGGGDDLTGQAGDPCAADGDCLSKDCNDNAGACR